MLFSARIVALGCLWCGYTFAVACVFAVCIGCWCWVLLIVLFCVIVIYYVWMVLFGVSFDCDFYLWFDLFVCLWLCFVGDQLVLRFVCLLV